jgi:hypothetical protein
MATRSPTSIHYHIYQTPDGFWLDGETLAMLNEAEHILGVKLPMYQGSYHKGVGASAGTHDKGGVIDVHPQVGKHGQVAIVRALRRVGFAAWHRPYVKGLWGEHIHAVDMQNKDLTPIAAQQVVAYKKHYNGLGHLGMGGKDDGPKVTIQTWAQYKARHPRRFPNARR